MKRPTKNDSRLKQSNHVNRGTFPTRSLRSVSRDMFSRLPNEILTIIFHHFVSSRAVPLENHRAPALLIPICRRFRDIVYGSPKLWATVVISERGGFLHLPDYLARSREVPIDVTMYPLDNQYSRTFLRRAAPILAQSHRWRRVVIGMRQAWRAPQPLLPTVEDAPILSHLYIKKQAEVTFDLPINGLEYVIPDYPNLRVLDIRTIDVDFNAITATNLQELYAKVNLSNDHAYNAFSVFINRNVSLLQVQLDMRLSREQDEAASLKPLTAISLPALTVFKARIPPQIAMKAFLHILDIPKLSQLSLRPPASALLPQTLAGDFTEFIPICIKKFELLAEIKLEDFSFGSYKVIEEDFEELGLHEMGIDVWVGRRHLKQTTE